MRVSSALAFAATLLAGSAVASANSWAMPRDSFCLCDSDADQIANDFADLISNFNQTFAEQVLAPDYTDQSDSVNTLIDATGGNIPLGSLTFATKAAFISASAQQPPVPFTILQTWHTCDTVIIRWVAHPPTVDGATAEQVQGFDALIVEPSTTGFQPYQIKTTYGEFNSGAWLEDLGSPECK